MENMNWQDFLDRLTKICKLDGSVKNFDILSNDIERLTFCLNHKLISTKLNDWFVRNCTPGSSQVKDSKLAERYKVDGNKYYCRKDDAHALDCYNQGLLHAAKADLGLLYGNRSAVLYNNSLWSECIEDIENALINNFPMDKMWKLYKRKGEALLKMKKTADAAVSFQKVVDLLEGKTEFLSEKNKVVSILESLDKNERQLEDDTNKEPDKYRFEPVNGRSRLMPNASKSLTLFDNAEQGRHVVANENLTEGSVIISETPYAAVLLPPWFESHCQHCFVKVAILFPCVRCTNVRYCSVKCQHDSWNLYHWFECGKLDLTEKIGIAHLALRIILVTDLSVMRRFTDVQTEPSVIPGCNDNGIYDASYESVYHLLPHSENLQVEDRFQYTLAGVLLYEVLLQNHFFGVEVSTAVKYHVGSLMIRHIQQLVCNAHAITSLNVKLVAVDSNLVEQDQVRIATAIYSTTSLLNHSCEPTILNSFHRNRLIVRLTKPVKKGEQIYNCYGPHYRRMDFTERQQTLKQQYFFTCKCEHCSKGSTSVDEMDCFRCKHCNQWIPPEKKNDCPHCGSQTSDYIDKYFKLSREAENLLAEGLEILRSEQTESSVINAIKILLKSLKIQEKIYFKNHSSLAKTYDFIARSYASMGSYFESLTYLKRSVEITTCRYGNTSIEVANELLKLSDIYMALTQQYIDSKNLKAIRSLLPEALQSMNRAIAVVELTKEPDSDELEELRAKKEGLMKLKYLS